MKTILPKLALVLVTFAVVFVSDMSPTLSQEDGARSLRVKPESPGQMGRQSTPGLMVSSKLFSRTAQCGIARLAEISMSSLPAGTASLAPCKHRPSAEQAMGVSFDFSDLFHVDLPGR